MKTFRSFGLAIVALCLLGAHGPAMRPYEVLVYGTVQKIDLRHHLIVVAYAPLDTAPGGVRAVRFVPAQTLRYLEKGDPIEAIADTRRTLWIVRDVHRLQ